MIQDDRHWHWSNLLFCAAVLVDSLRTHLLVSYKLFGCFRMEGEEEDAFLTDILQSLVKMSALVVTSSSVFDDDNERLSVDLRIME